MLPWEVPGFLNGEAREVESVSLLPVPQCLVQSKSGEAV